METISFFDKKVTIILIAIVQEHLFKNEINIRNDK